MIAFAGPRYIPFSLPAFSDLQIVRWCSEVAPAELCTLDETWHSTVFSSCFNAFETWRCQAAIWQYMFYGRYLMCMWAPSISKINRTGIFWDIYLSDLPEALAALEAACSRHCKPCRPTVDTRINNARRVSLHRPTGTT